MAMLEKAELTESSAETDSAQRGGVWGRRRAVGALWRLGTRVALFAASIAILFVLWIIGSRHFSPLILPGPTSVWHGFLGDWRSGFVPSDIFSTVEHLIIAYSISVLLGVPIGILIGRYWVIEDLTRAYLIFIQTIPTIVLIVLVLIFLGSTPTGVEAVTVASCFTYFTLNIIQGTKSIDRDLIEMAHTYGASELSIMRSIIFPSVIPFFLAAGRVTIGVAWQVTLFGEYLMGVKGIGFQIQSYIGLSQTANVYSWGIIVVLLTILFEYGLFRPIEWTLTRHTRRAT